MEYITQRGGEVQLNSRLQEIELAEDGNVAAFRLTDGRRVEGDLYISSMPGQRRGHSLSVGQTFTLTGWVASCGPAAGACKTQSLCAASTTQTRAAMGAVDVVKRIIPDQWRGMDYYSKLDMLVGVPVINVHIWCAVPLDGAVPCQSRPVHVIAATEAEVLSQANCAVYAEKAGPFQHLRLDAYLDLGVLIRQV